MTDKFTLTVWVRYHTTSGLVSSHVSRSVKWKGRRAVDTRSMAPVDSQPCSQQEVERVQEKQVRWMDSVS